MKRIFVQAGPGHTGDPSSKEKWTFRDLSFSPSLGMNILSLTAQRGAEVCELLLTPEMAQETNCDILDDPFASFKMGAAFLIPFANRISQLQSEIEFEGRKLKLQGDWVDEPSGPPKAIHGFYYNREITDYSVEGAFIRARDFCRDGWFCPFETSWKIKLSPEQLSIQVNVENKGEHSMPIGLGWHPYFLTPSQRRGNIELFLPAESFVSKETNDSIGLVKSVADTCYDFRNMRKPGHVSYDDTLCDLQKSYFLILDRQRNYQLKVGYGDEVKALHLYTPSESEFVCIEPQTHLPEAFKFNWGRNGLKILKAGQSITQRLHLDLSSIVF